MGQVQPHERARGAWQPIRSCRHFACPACQAHPAKQAGLGGHVGGAAQAGGRVEDASKSSVGTVCLAGQLERPCEAVWGAGGQAGGRRGLPGQADHLQHAGRASEAPDIPLQGHRMGAAPGLAVRAVQQPGRSACRPKLSLPHVVGSTPPEPRPFGIPGCRAPGSLCRPGLPGGPGSAPCSGPAGDKDARAGRWRRVPQAKPSTASATGGAPAGEWEAQAPGSRPAPHPAARRGSARVQAVWGRCGAHAGGGVGRAAFVAGAAVALQVWVRSLWLQLPGGKPALACDHTSRAGAPAGPAARRSQIAVAAW